MTDHLPFDLSGGLDTALRDRVADEHPDIDRLISVSTRAGTRLRRRRAAAASLSVAAVSVAMAGVVGAALGGGATGSAPGVATEPSASAPADETVTVDELRRLDEGEAAGAGPDVATPPDAAAPDETMTVDELQRLDEGEPQTDGARSRSDDLDELIQSLPVHVDPSSSGWGLGTPADDKFSAHKEGYLLSVNVRPRSELASWSGDDPDRPASQVVHTGENYFVTVQAGPEVPPRIVDELTAALRYDPVWKR